MILGLAVEEVPGRVGSYGYVYIGTTKELSLNDIARRVSRSSHSPSVLNAFKLPNFQCGDEKQTLRRLRADTKVTQSTRRRTHTQ